MPTTTQTNATNQYNPNSMNSYNMFQPQVASQLMQMVQNPLGSSYFQNQLAQQQAGANQVNQRSMANSLQNARTGGGILSNSGGYTNALINRNQIQGSMTQSNAFNTAMNSALQNRSLAAMSMQAYQPLQTGQNTTQSTGGLGTWLPQVAGAAMNMLMPGLGSMMGGQGFSAGYGGGGGGASAGSYANTMGTMPQQLNFNSGPPPNPFSGQWMNSFANSVGAPSY
jgi:hypothetical protein